MAKSELVKLPNRNIELRDSLNVLLSWEAAERIWKPKNRLWYLSYAAVILFLILIAARLGYYIVIVALVAFMLLWFVQGTIAPWVVKHKLTTHGIYTQGILLRWNDVEHFWFARKDNQTILYLDFDKRLKEPRMTILVPEGLDAEIFDICHRYITYGDETEIEYNFVAKLIYGHYLPLAYYIPDLDDQA